MIIIGPTAKITYHTILQGKIDRCDMIILYSCITPRYSRALFLTTMCFRFILTQIVCADICKDLARSAHEIKKRLTIPLKCACCQPEKQGDSNSIRYEQLGDSGFAENINLKMNEQNEQVSRLIFTYDVKGSALSYGNIGVRDTFDVFNSYYRSKN